MTEITATQVNSYTASVLLLHHSESIGQIDQQARDKGLFVIDKNAEALEPVWSRASTGLGALDAGLRSLSNQAVDFKSLIFLIFVIMGIRQLQQGQIFAPATALFWYALQLIINKKKGNQQHSGSETQQVIKHEPDN